MSANMPELDDGPVDEPLQLVEFVRTAESDETEIKLKHANLNRILEPCGDRPLLILTVCGPSRMGKSFLLGYMIRCLEALEKEESDWMDWENKTKPLTGFKFRSGVKPETQGIWVWSRPFKIKTEGGQEVCVLLVDTQGTQDEFTTTKEMSAIVGLSLLSSSVMIFNFFHNLQEDILVALNTYVQYGLLALEHSEGGDAPFQKLMFLIRDWNQPGDFPYGKNGGKQFLNEKLEVKPRQPKEAKEVRQTIRKCSNSLDCFLMPGIGCKALFPEFTGSISELEPLFARKLEEFISAMISVDNIVIKEMHGNQWTAADLRSYLQVFVEVFNSDETPTPTNILEATAKAHKMSQIQKACKMYEESLKKKLRGQQYFTNFLLEEAHEAAAEAARKVLQNMKKIGSSDADAMRMCIAELDNLVKEKYDQVKFQNEEKRRNVIALTTKEAASAFKGDLENQFPLTAQEEFYEENDLQKARESSESKVVNEFEEKLSEEDENVLLELKQSLNEQLDMVFQVILEKNRTHRLSSEKKMMELVNDLVEDYKNKLNHYITVNKFEDFAKIEKFHEDLRIDVTDSFKNIPKPGTKEFQKPYSEDLKTRFNETFQTIRDKLKLELNEIYETANQYVNEECGRYLTDLRASVLDDKNCLESEDLQNIQQEQKEKFIANFSISPYYPPETKQHSDLMRKVEEELENAFEHVQADLRVSFEKSKESIKTAKVQGLQYYQDGLKHMIAEVDGGYIDDQDLDDAHQRIKEESLDVFHNAPKTGPLAQNSDVLEKSLNELKCEIEEAFKNVKAENAKNLETAHLKAKNLVNACRAEYVSLMKKEIDEVVRTDEDLTAAHERTKTKVFKKFKDEVPIKSSDFTEVYLEQLEEEIEETFEEYVELYELKKTEDDTKMKGLFIECRQEYFKEMEKQCSSKFFIKPDHLDRIHATTKQIVINKLTRTGPSYSSITTVQREDLMKEMDNQFEAYKMKNDMKLNFEMDLGIAPAIGIDLGTTYCCVAVFYQGKVITIPNLDQGGNLTTPSYVAYSMNSKDVVIGEPAKENAYKDPENTIYDAKRIIGRKMKDPILQEDIKMWPFTVQENKGVPKIMAAGQLLYPEQVSAKLLAYFKNMAEKFLQLKPGTVKKAVITVPAYFNDGQRQATVDAGKLAGLEVLTILNEPTAAAIAYSLERLERTAKKVLVYDLGGGTFDVAVLNIDPNSKEIEVLGVDGDTHLGGEDFDKNLTNFCAERFKEKTGIDLFAGKNSFASVQRKEANRRLRRVQTYCENAKKQLATARSTKITIDAIANGMDLEIEISREKFEDLNKTMFQKTIEIVERALKTVKVKKEEIDDIVLVGGSSRILKVQEMLKTFFEGKALNHTIHPDHCVAYGAAVKAAIMNGEQSKGSIDFSKIQDVTPLSLGTDIVGGWMSTIVPRNTKIPCKKKRTYRTADDFQTGMDFDIFQGEAEVAIDNELIGHFVLHGIPPASRGMIPVVACMEINSMGILHVSAECKESGSKKSITIKENKMRMSKETIERLLAESA